MKPSDTSDTPPRPRWKQWLIDRLHLGSQNRDELLEDLQRANNRNILHEDAVDMIQGILQFSVLQVRDIMAPRSQINFIYHDDDFDTILERIAETEHSRYPVVDEDRDDLIGILLAKDLLKYIGRRDEFVIDDIIRPALLVPESQRLNRLLTEFRNSRSHMAIVIDEYSGVAGLVTFEDVLEQIVGDIDDEHDDAEEEFNIRTQDNRRYVMEGVTPIDELNAALGATFPQDDVDTVAGLVMRELGRIPRQGEELELDGYNFQILRSDNRRILLLEATRPEISTAAPAEEAAA